MKDNTHPSYQEQPAFRPIPPDIEVRVSQKPISVELECPECYHEASWPYDEFKRLYGDPADWTGSRIECPNCHKQYTIGNQTWD